MTKIRIKAATISMTGIPLPLLADDCPSMSGIAPGAGIGIGPSGPAGGGGGSPGSVGAAVMGSDIDPVIEVGAAGAAPKSGAGADGPTGSIGVFIATVVGSPKLGSGACGAGTGVDGAGGSGSGPGAGPTGTGLLLGSLICGSMLTPYAYY